MPLYCLDIDVLPSENHQGTPIVSRRPALPTWILLLAFASPAPFLDAEVPDWIADDRAREGGFPLWVSADRAVIDGELQWELFSTDGQKTLAVMVEGTLLRSRRRQHVDPAGARSIRLRPSEAHQGPAR